MSIDAARKIAALFAVNGSNALLPLLLFPLLANRLSSEGFAHLVSVEAVMLYIMSFSMLGYEVAGVKKIIHKKMRGKWHDIYFYVAASVTMRLLFAGFIVVLVSGIAFMQFGERYLYLSLIWGLHPIGVAMQPSFYFQAVSENEKYACVLIFSRLLSLVLGWNFIENEEDVYLACGFISGGFFLSGFVSLWLAAYSLRKKGAVLMKGRRADYFSKVNINLASANLFVGLFRGSNILLLRSFANAEVVVVYALAEKMVKIIQATSMPLNLYFQNKLNEDLSKKEVSRKYVLKQVWAKTKPQIKLMTVVVMFFIFAMSISKYILNFVIFDGKVIVLTALMSLSVFFGISNFMFGTLGMSILNASQFFTRNVFLVGLISIVLTAVSARYFSIEGVAAVFVLAEILLFFLVMSYYRVEK